MARKRTKAAEQQVEAPPVEQPSPEPVVEAKPEQPSPEAPKHEQKAHIANPSSTRRHADSVTRKLPGKLSVTAGDLRVDLIDAGRNEMGIGIRVLTPEGRKLSDEEKQIIREHIKGHDDKPSGFTWDANASIWHKNILRDGEHVSDVPPMRPVAIRLDAERRIEALAEALREHGADPVGYADMVKQRREAAAQDEHVKF